MKLVYAVNFFGKEGAGVQKKIVSQVRNLSNIGIKAEIYSITGVKDDSLPVPEVKKIIIPGLEYHSTGSFFERKKRIDIRDHALSTIIGTLQADDILYMRIPSPSRITSKVLKSPRKCKIVIEYQTIGPYESWLIGSYSYLLFDFFYGRDTRRYTDAIVGVTDEITQYELTRSGNPDKPHITIGNGFDVGSVNIRQHVPYNGEELRILCVANMRRWHGIDRLIRGLQMYRGPVRIKLHIAGNGAELSNLKKLVHETGTFDQVEFHGFTTGEELDRLFNTCHIAAGSLGIHRKGLTQTSELKVREYCARGIPFILSCTDPDFPEGFPYILRLTSDESPVQIDEIVKFAQNVSADPENPQKMNAYAAEYLDWSIKMKTLKAFLEKLI
jgi:glycosyltransferase involved in cell wall biosynthesis